MILDEKTESRSKEVDEALRRALESKKMTKEEGPRGRKKRNGGKSTGCEGEGR